MDAAWVAVSRRPRVWLVGMVAASAVIRSCAASLRSSPLYYPDEYLYSGLARSIAETGVPRIRGTFIHFPALVVPYLMAPAWLFHNVDVAYTLSLAIGSLAFSLAALPAFALARRVGITERGALLVAAFALLVPGGAFTTNLLSEPYAYPLFLATLLVAIDALATPTRNRQIGVVLLMAALCVTRIQFIFVPAAYLLTAVLYSRSVRVAVRRQRLVIAVFLVAGGAVAAVGVGRVAGVYAGITSYDLPPLEITRWFVVDLFVLLVAAGWVIVPGAVVGFFVFLRSGTASQRAFGLLSAVIGVGLVGQAAFFGANEGRVHERYTFYLAPLAAIGFVYALEHVAPGRLYRLSAYGVAAAAIIVPAGSEIRRGATDESPTILGLRAIAGGGDRAALVWALALSALAVLVGARVATSRVTVLASIVILVAVGATGTRQLLRFGTSLGFELGTSITDVPRLSAPHGTALVTGPQTNRFLLMETLFWNPSVTRVLDLGSRAAADGYSSTPVRIGPGGGLIDGDGAAVSGPFAFDSDTTAADAAGSPRVFGRVPPVIVFGMNRDDGYLQTVTRLYAVATDHALVVSMWLVSPTGAKTVNFACGSKRRRAVRVGGRPRRIRIEIRAESRLSCRISLVAGAPVTHRNRTVSVIATRLRVQPTANT